MGGHLASGVVVGPNRLIVMALVIPLVSAVTAGLRSCWKQVIHVSHVGHSITNLLLRIL